MKPTPEFLKPLTLFLGATTFLFTAGAQDQATLTPIGQWPEYPLVRYAGAVRLAGTNAFVAGYPPLADQQPLPLRVLALDVGVPSQPRYLGHLDVPSQGGGGSTLHMCLSGNYAYILVGNFYGGDAPPFLAVVDVSQPAQPRLAGTYQFPDFVCGMDVAGNHLYIGAYSPVSLGSLLVIDVSDPVNPFLKGSTSTVGSTTCVSVAGNYAYVGGSVRHEELDYHGRVNVIDISDPAHPVEVGGLDRGGVAPQEHQRIHAIHADGPLLHLGMMDSHATGLYEILSLSDPVNPSLLGACQLSRSENPAALRVSGNTAYLATWDALRIIDISNRQSPRVQGTFTAPSNFGVPTDAVDVSGEYAYYLVWARAELGVIDVNVSNHPLQVGQFDLGFAPNYGASRIQVCAEKNLAYLLDFECGKLRVLNAANPRAPTLVGAADLTFAGPFEVVNHHAYIATGSSLQILDVTDSAHPAQAGRFTAPSTGVDVVGTRAYLTGSSPTNRLTAIETANPAALRLLGYLNLPGSPGPPQVVGNFAYYRLEDTHLVIVDIQDPSHMVEVGRYYATNGLSAFQVSGPYAYLLRRAWTDGTSLHVVELADPAHPRKVGEYVYDPGDDPARIDLQNLYVSGRYAFVALSESGTNRVDILDVSEPAQPVKTGEYFPASQFSSFMMSGNTLYTASDAGLTILNFFDPTAPLQLYPPILSATNVALSWTGGPRVALQKATSLSPANWQGVPGAEGISQLTLPRTNPTAFFRLIQQ